MKQLTPGDAFMLYTETPGSPNHIGSLGIFDPATAPGGSLSFEQLLEYYAERIHLGKSFRRRLVRVPMDLDDPWWVEDSSFDLEYHLRHTALPAPGDWNQLCALVGRLHSRPLDLSRPPWEAWLIEGLNAIPGVPPGSIGILIRVHHTAIDGVGGIELLSALLQLNPDDAPPDVPDTWEPERVPSPWELLGRATLNNAQKPWRLARAVAKALPAAARLPSRIRSQEIKVPSLTVPTTRFNAKVSPHRSFDAATFALADLKAIKSAVPGATVNDAVMAVCAGALRIYLDKLGELPEASLAAVVPMSLRTQDEAGNEGNRVAQFFCSLHTDIADPLQRLAEVARSTKEAKGSQQALGAHSLQQMSSVLPGAVFGMALRANAEIGSRTGTTGFMNTQISNIPGPPFPLYCAGAKLISMYGLGPVITGAGLIHVIMSYCDVVTFSFTTDRDIMPDPANYAEALRISFDELLEATAPPA
ncbi:MAG TPA: wax ester/triacylglycerol synthase family O-acyltransferase [Acidimicrobiales bacterium]|nr:wax ester/triacylglycerol synthase family O-acyltransferase [Acidimicrobiales bacterium]